MKRKFPLVVGNIYHVYNRGVAKCTICASENDFWRFLQGLCLFNDQKTTANILWQLERNRGRLSLNILKDYVLNSNTDRKPLVRIMAYCIMNNHYHFLLEELFEGGITRFMHKLGAGYARYFNNKHDRVGSLFQDKFKNILVDNDRYLQYLLVYINVLNPAQYLEPKWKEKGFHSTKSVLDYVASYPWSTHQEYLGKRNSIIIEKGILSELFPTPKEYLNLVTAVIRDKKYNEISHLTLE
jgi:putative transposase